MSDGVERSGGDMAVTKPVEFIDYNCDISDSFNEYLRGEKFEKFGFRYNVLSILGCQSSGKSSLLNAVFGLSFDVMDTKLGHSQTTKGLWGALVLPEDAEQHNATLVIDVEGTDSRERGEGRLTFEHRSSLLCLAISDCVVINLWYHSLGNLTGSNYGLLKTVMEANLELMEGTDSSMGPVECKTILCFCIRDWFPELAPLETVRGKIVNGYMQGIWSEIHKPAKFQNAAMEDVFRIELFGFNHALAHKEEFAADARRFRSEWLNNIRPTSYSRAVPSDGFFYYARNILNTVKEQNHLDIPTQREMLANFRCQEIKVSVLGEVEPKVAAMLADAQSGSVVNFSERAAEVADHAVEAYLESASRYDAETSQKIGRELVRALLQKMQPSFDALMAQECSEIAVRATVKMEEKFSLSGKGRSLLVGGSPATEAWPKFTESCESIRSELWESLNARMQAHSVSYSHQSGIAVDHAFDTTAASDMFNVTFRNEVDVVKKRHLHALREQIADLIDAGFKVIETVLLENGVTSDKYWGAVNSHIEQAYQSSLDLYRSCYGGMISPVQSQEFEYFAFVALVGRTKANLDRVESRITEIIVERFEQFFMYQERDGESIPRAWESCSEDELQQTYARCKKEALNVVAVIRDCRPSKLKVPRFDVSELKPTHVLYRELSTGVSGLVAGESSLSDDVLVDTVKACKLRFHELYHRAHQIQSYARGGISWRTIPTYFWVLLLVCAWNEICTALRVIFKVQVLIPVVILVFLAVQYGSTYVFGDSARAVLEPLKAQARSLCFQGARWAFHAASTAVSVARDVRGARSARSASVPEDDDGSSAAEKDSPPPS
ncbi:root hair defective 3 GTP binding protein, putative [Babesia bigemina]|uniref:Protein SEY1 homolog n=1 Tax=Babesia bigemina TaxID=5866 RepID=A0A061DB31_BABBI|nr:root hair defective 3 GTP binding protein, putative [Babesia bigemina]CDR94935.1 root hair defective 3 GTP binding protein, putative [Babesia bigemina]|eukprot:XP_012767121.1 root hair defective 3 GTP binding protein, putative [Babesia bigemina]